MAAFLVGLARARWGRRAATYGVLAGAVLLIFSGNRRASEGAGRLAERLEAIENANEIQRRMLEDAADRPRGCNDLARRLRAVRF